MKKRILSLLLAVCMVISILPMTAFAGTDYARLNYWDASGSKVTNNLFVTSSPKYFYTRDGYVVTEADGKAADETDYNIKLAYPAGGVAYVYLRDAVINHPTSGGLEIGGSTDDQNYKIVIEPGKTGESSIQSTGAYAIRLITNGEVTVTSEDNAKLTVVETGATAAIQSNAPVTFKDANVVVTQSGHHQHAGIHVQDSVTVDGGRLEITSDSPSIWLWDSVRAYATPANASGVARNVTVKNGAYLVANSIGASQYQKIIGLDGDVIVESANINLYNAKAGSVLEKAAVISDDCTVTANTTSTYTVEHNHAATPAEPVMENKTGAACESTYDSVVYCAVCGKSAEISRTPTDVTPPPSVAHTVVDAEKKNEVAATAAADGSYDLVGTCSVCGDLVTETVVVPRAMFKFDGTEVVLLPGKTQELYDGAIKLEYPVDGIPTMTLDGLDMATAKGIEIGGLDNNGVHTISGFDVKIVVASASTIANTNANYPAINSKTNGTVTITGAAKLTLNDSGYFAGLRAVKDVVFKDANVEIFATGDNTHGIFITEGNLTVDGGNVNVTAAKKSAIWLCDKGAVAGGSIAGDASGVIKNITVKNDANLVVNATNTYAVAIGYNGTLTIDNANLEVNRTLGGNCLQSEPKIIGDHTVTGGPMTGNNVSYIVKKALPEATIVFGDASNNDITKTIAAGTTLYLDVVDGVIVDSADSTYNIKVDYPADGVPTIYFKGAEIVQATREGFVIGAAGDALDYNVVVESASSIETAALYRNTLEINTTGKVTFSGAQLTLKATTSNSAFYAAAGGDVEFKDANVIIDNSCTNPVTIAGNLIIDGGSVAITSAVQALNAAKDITLKNGADLTVSVGETYQIAVAFNGAMTIDNANLTVNRTWGGNCLSKEPVLVGSEVTSGVPCGDNTTPYIVEKILPKATIGFGDASDNDITTTIAAGETLYFDVVDGVIKSHTPAQDGDYKIKFAYPADGVPTIYLKGANVVQATRVALAIGASGDALDYNVVVESTSSLETAALYRNTLEINTTGKVTFSGAELTLKATTQNSAFYAAAGGDVEFKNANVVIDNGGSNPVTIAGNLIIDGSNVAITSAVQALNVAKDITLKNDADLTVSVGETYQIAVAFNGAMTIDNANLTVNRTWGGNCLSKEPVLVGSEVTSGVPCGDNTTPYIVVKTLPKAHFFFNTKWDSRGYRNPAYLEAHSSVVLSQGEVKYFATQVGAIAENAEASYVVESTSDNWSIKLEYPTGGTPKMTLKDATITSIDGIVIGGTAYGVTYDNFDLDIIVEGTNTILPTAYQAASIRSLTNGTVTISGDGKLIVGNGGGSNTDPNSAIVTVNDLILQGVDVEFKDVVSSGLYGSRGITSTNGDVIIDGANIFYLKKTGNRNFSAIATPAGDIIIKNDSVVRIGTYDGCTALDAAGEIKVIDSALEVAMVSYTTDKMFSKAPQLIFNDYNGVYDIYASSRETYFFEDPWTIPNNEGYDPDLIDTYNYFSVKPHKEHTFENKLIEVLQEGDCQNPVVHLVACENPDCDVQSEVIGNLGDHVWSGNTCTVCGKEYAIGDTPYYIVNVGKDFGDYVNDQYVMWTQTVDGELKLAADVTALAKQVKMHMDNLPAGSRYIAISAQRQIFYAYVENAIFFDKAAPVFAEMWNEFLAEYKAIGGKLDGVAVDFEYVFSGYWFLSELYEGKLVMSGKEIEADPEIFAKIAADQRYIDDIRPLLVERGFSFYPTTDGQSELYSLYYNSGDEYATSRQIWNNVIHDLQNEVVNEAMAPLFTHYPEAQLSDYEQAQNKPWLSGTGATANKVGNTSNYVVYFNRPGAGVKPMGYLGDTFELTPFNRTMYDVNTFKGIYASDDDKNVSVWISDYLKNSDLEASAANTAYYSEMIYHLGMMNPTFLGYIVKEETGEDLLETALNVANELMAELSKVAGTNDRTPIELPISWNSKFILSGMTAGGRNIWRITPDTSVATKEAFKVDGTTFEIGGQTITFPQGTIIDDATIDEVGTCGYWVETPAGVMPEITSEATRYSAYETAANLTVYDVETGYTVDAEVARTEATAYRVDYVNASEVNKIVKVYNNGELIEELTVAPGTDGYIAGTVSAASNLLTVEIVDEETACEHAEMLAIAAKDPTYSVAGNTAYYFCEECGKYFSDAEGQTEIEENSWVLAPLATNSDTTNLVFTKANANSLGSMILGANLQANLNISTKKTADYDEIFVEMTKRGVTTRVNPTTTVGSYWQVRPILSAAEMTCDLTLTVCGVKDGVVYVGETQVWNFRTGAEVLMNSYYPNYATNERARLACDMVMNLLNYGAESQIRFGINTEFLATENLPNPEWANLIDRSEATLNEIPAATDTAYKLSNANLMLQDNVKVAIFFYNKSGIGDLSAYRVEIVREGDSGSQTYNYSGDQLKLSGTKYLRCDFAELAGAQIKDTLKITLYKDEVAVSATYTRDISMIAQQYTATMPDLVNAIMHYADSAKAYFDYLASLQ